MRKIKKEHKKNRRDEKVLEEYTTAGYVIGGTSHPKVKAEQSAVEPEAAKKGEYIMEDEDTVVEDASAPGDIEEADVNTTTAGAPELQDDERDVDDIESENEENDVQITTPGSAA